ncbi:MAG: AAA family ATPase [Candidatus Colwellbacteria bacterium]|nr:AAA family ATPase [Candidatus Colwellbacteria bacterium]
MLLNRLELQGFKSFPDKISLDLGHQITAVVGPNGSGKSNITDSVRWLLGERDARNLRGGKGEDLIFAGTEGRPRVGLAQATIYFNNSSNFFPYDFKEVSISRRINRDGLSQFFINKSEVRLKDLIDVLAKVKLGARGLTIINQGENDTFLKASPVERRAMIEEILGLKEYQLKKADGVRRLEATIGTLEKAKALIEELKPHLRSLKRQVARYEGRELLAKELRELENNFYGSRLEHLEKELDELNKNEEKIKTALKKQQSVLEKIETEFQRISESEPQAMKEMKGFQAEREKLFGKRSSLIRELTRIEAQMEFQKEGRDVNAAGLQKAVEEIKTIAHPLLEETDGALLRAGLKRISELIDGLFKSGIRRPSTDGGGLQEAFKKYKAEIDLLDRELKGLNQKENERRELLEGFNQKFREAHNMVEQERKELERLRDEENKVLLGKERAETRLADLKEELSQIGLDIKSLNVGTSDVPNITLMSGHRMSDEEALKRMFKLRSELAGIGEVDEALVKEAQETEERYDFLTKEVGDLEAAVGDLKNLIHELEQKIQSEFNAAIKTINEEFTKLIRLIFTGGKARLVVQVNNNSGENEKFSNNDAGIDIEVSLPKKKVKGLDVLSGGERSSVSIAALFALISVSPPPFLVLDEVDAALDEDNARRFSQILKDFSRKTQFVVVTHNRVTMEAADVLYGVTMSPDGTSKIVSLKLG